METIQGDEMIVHAVLFILLPLAVAWLAGATAYFPPYPAPKTEPEIEPALEAEVRAFLARHSEPDVAADSRTVPGVQANTLMDGAASAERLAANDLPSGPQSRVDEGDLAA
jgi:hypothetical protein